MASKRYALKKLKQKEFEAALVGSHWEESEAPLVAIQQGIAAALQANCPKARPSVYARREWSPRAAELLAGARHARRRYTTNHREEDLQSHKTLANQLKKEIRRAGRTNWRRMLEEVTSNPAKPYNEGLWGLSRWSRRSAGKPYMDPHIPELRRRVGDEYSTGNAEKAEIFKEKFNPTAVQVDLADINVEEQHQYRQDPTQPSPEVSKAEINQIIKGLATGKTPGPDGVPNEVLKLIPSEVKEGLAKAISASFRVGRIPAELKESTTYML